jgi:hypothetical protein
MRDKLSNKKKKKMPNKIFFKIVESDNADKYGRRWKFLVDKSGSIWGMYWTYRNAKWAIQHLRRRYYKTLMERGTFSLEELQNKKR